MNLPTQLYYRHCLILLALSVIAVVARMPITQLDFNSLLQTFLVDDAFYDFKVAANIVNLHRITYDGDGLSNGYHPLWMLIITPFYTNTHGGLDFVTRVQWIMLGIQTAAVISLYLLLLRIRASTWIAFAGAAILASHSTFVDFESNGLETSLNTFMLLALLHAFLSVYASPLASMGPFLVFGFFSAMAFLSRTDNAIALVILFSVLLPQIYREKKLHYIAAAGSLELLLASPWLLWNQINFGSIVQTSGKVDGIFLPGNHSYWQLIIYTLIQAPLRIFHFSRDLGRLFLVQTDYPAAIAAALLMAWLISLLVLLRPRQRNSLLRATAWFSLAVFAVYCYHAGVRNFVRNWYCTAAALALFLGYWGALVHLSQQTTTYGKALAGCGMAAWLTSVLWLHSPTKLPGATTNISTHITVSDWINTNLPQEAIIGSMNSGTLSYLVQRKVINLDGVMDLRSLQAHWQQRLPQYIHERGIQYLVDNRGALRPFCEDNSLHSCETVFQFGSAKNPGLVVRIVNKP